MMDCPMDTRWHGYPYLLLTYIWCGMSHNNRSHIQAVLVSGRACNSSINLPAISHHKTEYNQGECHLHNLSQLPYLSSLISTSEPPFYWDIPSDNNPHKADDPHSFVACGLL